MTKTGSILLLACLVLASCHRGEKVEGVRLADFPTRQQTTEYTCGPVAAMMVMDYYGVPHEGEDSLAVLMHTHTDSGDPAARPGSAIRWTDRGTSVQEMYDYFAHRGDMRIVESSYDNDESIPDTANVHDPLAVGNREGHFEDCYQLASFFHRQLSESRPVLVCWNAWGGHWTVCIGYDACGTPDNPFDDILLMADPCDITDLHPDGLTQVSLAHFFHDWFCTMTPKPYQLQPYLVVGRLTD